MEVWNPEHPHHAVWREYTQSLMDGKPKVVDCKLEGREWAVCSTPPSFWPDTEYRIARPTLTLAYTVPMPVTEPLEEGQVYWLSSQWEEAQDVEWDGSETDMHWLKFGRVYLTREDAQAAIDARAAAMRDALEAAK